VRTGDEPDHIRAERAELHALDDWPDDDELEETA
jgi:hypothetical protein